MPPPTGREHRDDRALKRDIRRALREEAAARARECYDSCALPSLSIVPSRLKGAHHIFVAGSEAAAAPPVVVAGPGVAPAAAAPDLAPAPPGPTAAPVPAATPPAVGESIHNSPTIPVAVFY